MSQNATPTLDALQELAAIRAYVLDAQRQLQSGHMPDMTSLEKRTADLCRIIRVASGDVQKQCAPELADLAHDLDDCEQGLRAFCETVLELSPEPIE